jgi:predicted permease
MLIPTIRSFFRNRFRRAAAEMRLDTEIEGYVQLVEAELRAEGLPPAEARRRAIISVGGVEDVKERVRDARTGASFDALLHDLRFAFRSLRRSPVFSLTTVITLSLGLGATIVVLAIADAVLIRSLPYRDADRLVTILQNGNDPVSPANFLDWKAAATSYSGMEGASYWTPTITEGTPEQIEALQVTPGMLRMLGAAPQLGAGFTGDARARELVLSYSLWQKRFAADPAIVGRTVSMENEPYVVVGVMRPDFQFAPFWVTKAQAWVPLDLVSSPASRDASFLRVFGRLRESSTMDQAQRELDVITGRIATQFPESNKDIRIVSLKAKAVGNSRPALLGLLGAVVCVLLMTWVNVAHMLLARAYAREKELSVRVALGASRFRIIRESLAESALLSVFGGAVAMASAATALRLIAANGPFDLPQLRNLSLDGRGTAIAASLVAVTSIVVGLLPGLLANQSSRGTGMRLTTRGATGGVQRTRLRQLLIASEMAFAIVLLVGTALMVRTFAAMRAVDPGFVAGGVVTMQVPLPRATDTGAARLEWYRRVRERARAVPGVRDAGFINHLPLAGDEWGTRAFGGVMENAAEGDVPRSVYRTVTPGLMETLRMHLVEGRTVEATDDLNHHGVVLINRRLARQFWPGGGAVGQRLTFAPPGGPRSWRTVIGVVDDVKQSQWTAPSDPEIYIPVAQARGFLEGNGPANAYLTLVARTTTDASAVTNAVRDMLSAADPTAVVTHVVTLEEVVNGMTARARFLMTVLGGFGLLALVLAAVGVYGVLSYTVSQRRQELGIRMALGASPGSVTRTIATQTAVIAAAGIAAGSIGAAALGRLIQTQLYGVTSTDPLSFGVAAVALALVALLGATGPVRRAVRIDPLTAIRAE